MAIYRSPLVGNTQHRTIPIFSIPKEKSMMNAKLSVLTAFCLILVAVVAQGEPFIEYYYSDSKCTDLVGIQAENSRDVSHSRLEERTGDKCIKVEKLYTRVFISNTTITVDNIQSLSNRIQFTDSFFDSKDCSGKPQRINGAALKVFLDDFKVDVCDPVTGKIQVSESAGKLKSGCQTVPAENDDESDGSRLIKCLAPPTIPKKKEETPVSTPEIIKNNNVPAPVNNSAESVSFLLGWALPGFVAFALASLF